MKRYLLLFAILFIAAGLLAQAPTISSLSVTGTTLKWYNASTGGTQYTDPANTALVNGQIYYVSQTVNGVESATRVAITATLITQAAPTTGTHTPSQTQVVWNWNTVTGATGYKWSTANLYSGATDLSNVLTKTETSLTCNTAYTRYVWAYNSSGCVSAVTTLSQTTSSCVAAPAITTNAVTNIGSTTATLNGNITSINGANATTRGFKYSTTNGFNPASAGTNISETGSYSTGSYSLIPSGLTSTTTYYVVAYATNSAGTAYGSQVSFTTIVYSVWTFTNAGATGYTGPTQAQVNSVYSGTSLAGGVTISSGKQYWAVPVTGTYRIEAYGAQGGNVGAYTGGLGAKISGEFNLTAGEVIHIIAGQQGVAAGSGSGGGGGSFAVKTPFNTNGSVLVIGGGGGGSLSYVPGAMNGYSGLAGNSGGTTSNPGGSDLTGCFGPGAGGTNGNGGTQGCAAGGGGFFGNGVDGGHQAAGGVAFVSGGNGGISTNGGGLTHGGFGCGGAGSPSNGYGGGGGGYSGGGGGGWNGTSAGNGGGGGSYNAGTNQTNTAGSNSGHGQVIITKL